MAYYMLLLPRQYQQGAVKWGIVYKLIFLGATALLSLSFSWHMLFTTTGYGDYIAPGASIDAFPESDAHNLLVSYPVAHVLVQYIIQFWTVGTMTGILSVVLAVALPIICIRGYKQAIQDETIKARLHVFVLLSLFLGGMGFFITLIGYRIALYTWPLIFALIFPVALMALAKKYAHQERRVLYMSLMVIMLVAFHLDGAHPKKSGYMVEISDAEQRFHQMLTQLSQDVIIAGWPAKYGVVGNISYLAERITFLHHKIHLPMHTEFTLQMRRRMEALIAAYFATDIQDVYTLRDNFKVDYMIVEPKYFDTMPEYFKPFDKTIHEQWSKGKEQGFILQDYLNQAMFHQGGMYLIDLHSL